METIPRKTNKVLRKTKKHNMTPSSVELIAQNHEQCLKLLANSNNNLASACKRLSNSLRKRERKSAVFNLRF